ncbi:unnamed protein product [Brachionus calyciflorus]|uniref:Coiled-coil domain-containing protein 83 n=1 Tax=Brachionus calyciflorus TaxID=104777 RepID=A0A813MQ51_9BILA|nr:unnamed protein product [Brachionus calyciflorus]
MPKEKSKKSKAPKIDYFEAITTYKINLKEKELQEANEELNKLVERNFYLKERNDRLNQAKEQNIRKALQDYKNYTNEINSRKRCERDDVLCELKNLWAFKESLDKDLLEIRKDIKNTEKEISKSKRNLKYWHDFRKSGSDELEAQIYLLKKELADMNENYEIISNTLRNSTKSTIDQIKRNTEDVIEKKNKIVAEKCLKFLDKDSIEMSRENEWTKEKISVFSKELNVLQEYVADLEQENIKLMAYLFECNSQEVSIIRSVISNQFLDNDNLEENSIMNVDLNQLESVRPKSALDLTIKKLKEIELKYTNNDEISRREYDSNDEQDYDDAKPNQKKLYLDGHKKELIRQSSVTDEEYQAQHNTGEFWPITQEMLNSILKSK